MSQLTALLFRSMVRSANERSETTSSRRFRVGSSKKPGALGSKPDRPLSRSYVGHAAALAEETGARSVAGAVVVLVVVEDAVVWLAAW